MSGIRFPLIAGLTAFLVAFLLLLRAGYPDIASHTLPLGDLAADTLLVRRALHGLLLTGHYNYNGVHHPGPYMLYMQALGVWLTSGLAPGVAGSPYGGQIVGALLNNALFTGLFAALMQRLLRHEGLRDGQAAMLALVTLLPLLAGLGRAVTNPWIPCAIILPFASLLLSVLLLWRGSAGALVAASYCTGVLVHAYIPMPLIAGPLWLAGVVVGARRRRAAGCGGFPAWAWLISGLVIALFLAPMLLDLVLNPPGNLMKILGEVIHPSRKTPAPTLSMLMVVLLGGRQVFPHLLPLLFLTGAGMALALAGFNRALWRDLLVLGALTVLVSLLAYAGAPTPVMTYWGFYLCGGMVLAAALGLVCLAIQGSRWRRGTLLLLAGSLAGLLLAAPSPVARSAFARDYYRMADWVMAQVPPAGRVELLSTRRRNQPAPVWRRNALGGIFVAALIVELDWRGVSVCHRDPDAAIFATPEFTCAPTAAGQPVRVFEFTEWDECPATEAAAWGEKGYCISARLLPDTASDGRVE